MHKRCGTFKNDCIGNLNIPGITVGNDAGSPGDWRSRAHEGAQRQRHLCAYCIEITESHDALMVMSSSSSATTNRTFSCCGWRSQTGQAARLHNDEGGNSGENEWWFRRGSKCTVNADIFLLPPVYRIVGKFSIQTRVWTKIRSLRTVRNFSWKAPPCLAARGTNWSRGLLCHGITIFRFRSWSRLAFPRYHVIRLRARPATGYSTIGPTIG